MTADLFRMHIDGRCGGGTVCRHCRRIDKRGAARLARARLKAETRREVAENTDEPEKEPSP